jgi:zinc transport system ATP-binding protein
MTNTCSHCCAKIENLSVRLGDALILDNINLHVNCNELIAVVGANGAGKTTLLRAILGEIPYSGIFHFQIKGSSNKKPIIGYVPQKLHFELDSPISVADFVGITISRKPVWLGLGSGLKQEIQAALSRFGVAHLMPKKIGEISGGEMQKVLLSIAMTPVPNLLLLDEPDAGVDAEGRLLFYSIIDDIKKQYDISIIMVTHDLEGISNYADKIIELNKGMLLK